MEREGVGNRKESQKGPQASFRGTGILAESMRHVGESHFLWRLRYLQDDGEPGLWGGALLSNP